MGSSILGLTHSTDDELHHAAISVYEEQKGRSRKPLFPYSVDLSNIIDVNERWKLIGFSTHLLVEGQD